jgi:hypothetical protein
LGILELIETHLVPMPMKGRPRCALAFTKRFHGLVSLENSANKERSSCLVYMWYIPMPSGVVVFEGVLADAGMVVDNDGCCGVVVVVVEDAAASVVDGAFNAGVDV